MFKLLRRYGKCKLNHRRPWHACARAPLPAGRIKTAASIKAAPQAYTATPMRPRWAKLAMPALPTINPSNSAVRQTALVHFIVSATNRMRGALASAANHMRGALASAANRMHGALASAANRMRGALASAANRMHGALASAASSRPSHAHRVCTALTTGCHAHGANPAQHPAPSCTDL